MARVSAEEAFACEVIAYLEQCAGMWERGCRGTPAVGMREILIVTGAWSPERTAEALWRMAEAGLIAAAPGGEWELA